MLIIIYLIIAFVCLALPLILTTINIINLFAKKRIKENLVDILTFVFGLILTMLLYVFHGFKDYNEALRLGRNFGERTCTNCIMEYANSNCNIIGSEQFHIC